MNKHTKGPWKLSPDKFWLIEGDGKTIAEIYYKSSKFKYPNEIDANAQLIAAAPEMLELLKEVRIFVGELPSDNELVGLDLLHSLRFIIKKAGGEI